MKIKTAELDGVALDWAAAYALNGKPIFIEAFGLDTLGRSIVNMVGRGFIRPSREWVQGGPLIEHYRMNLLCESENYWQADPCVKNGVYLLRYNRQYGKTPLIAAMRAIAALELGDYVDAPEELIE